MSATGVDSEMYMKIQCDNCGRKATVFPDDESRTPMQYCRRCGDELPPREEWGAAEPDA